MTESAFLANLGAQQSAPAPAPTDPESRRLADMGAGQPAAPGALRGRGLGPDSGDPFFAYDAASGYDNPDAFSGTQYQMSSEEWSYLSNLLGYDAHAAYQNFSQHYVIAAQHRRSGQQLGYDQVGLWTSGNPQNLQPGWELTAANKPAYGVGADQYKPTPTQWRYFMLNSLQGTAGLVAGGVAQNYEQTNGVAMPAELRKQIGDAVQNAPQQVREQLMSLYGPNAGQAAGQTAAAAAAQGSTAGPDVLPSSAVNPPSFIGDLISAYNETHPTPTMLQAQEAQREQQLRNSVISDWLSALGSQPTADQVNEMVKMSDTQRQDFINNQPAPGGLGITYGAYQYQHDRLNKQWLKYFGRTPTGKEILWGMGQSDAGIQEFIDSQPSHKFGMTIGEYEGTQNFAADLSKQYFGYDDPKHLLAMFDAAPKK